MILRRKKSPATRGIGRAPRTTKELIKEGRANELAIKQMKEAFRKAERRGIYIGLSQGAQKVTKKQADSRENRASLVTLVGAAPPLFVAGVLHANRLVHNPGFVKSVASLIYVGIPVAMVLAPITYGVHLAARRGLEKHIKVVENSLVKEIRENQTFKAFLEKHKYVVIDRKGNVKGVKRRPLKWGQIAIETKTLLEASA